MPTNSNAKFYSDLADDIRKIVSRLQPGVSVTSLPRHVEERLLKTDPSISDKVRHVARQLLPQAEGLIARKYTLLDLRVIVADLKSRAMMLRSMQPLVRPKIDGDTKEPSAEDHLSRAPVGRRRKETVRDKSDSDLPEETVGDEKRRPFGDRKARKADPKRDKRASQKTRVLKEFGISDSTYYRDLRELKRRKQEPTLAAWRKLRKERSMQQQKTRFQNTNRG